MKKLIGLLGTVLVCSVISSCSKNDDKVDADYPVIDLSYAASFPVNCTSLTRGQRFTFKARFTDNAGLGSYSLDVHHNFDHHSHSTETSSCEMGAVKTAVKPWLLIRTTEIPGAPLSYEASAEIEVPADIDPGDYHFMVKVTDKAGWQSLRGISFKIN